MCTERHNTFHLEETLTIMEENPGFVTCQVGLFLS